MPIITIDGQLDDIALNDQHIDLTDTLISYHTDLTDILRRETQLYIKSYGAGSSSTLSIRGGTANQTVIRWQDIPVNNPMLGLSDISLLSAGLFDQLSVSRGGGSSAYGNGAITGVLDLKNHVSRRNSLSVHTTIGSMGQKQANATLSYNHKKLSGSTKILYMKNKNNFRYRLSNGDLRNNSHAASSSKALLQTLSYAIDADKVLRYDFWIQDTYREIPPTSTQTRSEATQSDALYRHVLNYKQQMHRWQLNSSVAYFRESNAYSDPQILLDNNNVIDRIYHKTEAIISLSDTELLTLSYDFNHVTGQTEAYSNSQSISYHSLYTKLQKKWQAHTVYVGLRNEISSLGQHFTSPSIDYNYSVSQSLVLSAKISREYRFPTLNELHWQPGGNLDLLPEQGWNQEVSATYHKKNSKLSLASYHRVINDWILWGLPDNMNFWAAYNLSKVRSYGIELNYNHRISIANWQIEIDGGYNHTVSKNLKSSANPKINKGDQLFYTPIHIATLNLNNSYRNWQWSIYNRYTSSTAGVISELPGYLLVSTELSYRMMLWEQSVSLSFVIENITDRSYRVIERRPMPGRNYFIHFNIRL